MRFEILGPLHVRSEDGALDLGAPAQRELLAVLLTSPNAPVSDDRLVDELWGDDPPPSAHHLVQVYVSRLRALLDPANGPRIVRERAGYTLRVEADELDAERFLAAVSRGREVRDSDPEAADEILAGAMRLWHGTPFVEFSDAPPAVRELAGFLERRRLEALEAWFGVRLQLGRHQELVSELAELVERHPYNEALHAQLVLALYRCGRQAEALQIARGLQERLREELGIDVSPELRDLYRDILLQAPRLSLEPPEPPGNLPTRLTSFVGRGRELQQLTELIEASRLLTLTGPGGIGKTRLALEVARRVRAQFPGGVWWIDLAPVADPGSVLDEVARILGVTAAGMELGDAVARALRRRKALLLIDNCEHVTTAVAEAVERLLGATTGPQILATSRTPLGIEHERRWPVPPLSLPPETETLERLDESDAVRLFVERARAVLPSFSLDGNDAAAVAEACRRLDGVSLSVEIAAAQLSEQTPQELVRRLDERFALLKLPAAEGLTRHASVEAALDASYVLLSEQERTVFDRLSAFAGPFELDDAAAVGSGGGEASNRAIADVLALARASLLTPERDGVEKRYRLLETVREYGIARLRARGAEDAARRVHADHHLGLAEQAGAALGTPGFAPWMDRLSSCYAEVRQALAWSLEHQERAVSLRAAPALRELWYRQGWAREAGRWGTSMLTGDLRGVPPTLLAEAHNAAGLGADLAMDFSAAVSHLDEAVRRSREAAYLPGLVFGLWGRAAAAFALGDVGSMRSLAVEALSVCEQAGDRWGRAGPLAILGNASLFADGELAEARAWLEEALPLYRQLGDVGGLVTLTLTPLSEITRRQRDLGAAELFATEALEVASGTAWEATALVQYALVLGELGEVDAAEAAALRGLRLALETGLEQWFRLGLRELSRTFARRSTWEEAATLLAASRRGIPALLLDVAVLGPLEQACRAAVGDDRFEELAARGEAMSHEELIDLVGAADP